MVQSVTEYTYEDLVALGESVEIEFKKALGQNANGELPKEFWPSYSAMANTEGGEILLGVEELKPSGLKLHDLANVESMRQDIFNLANNSQKVNVNLLRDGDVTVMNVNGCRLLRVRVPRASRRQRPIYAKSVHSLRNQIPSRNDAQSAPSQHAGDQRPRRGRVPLIRPIDDGRCMGTIVRRDSQPLA